MDYNMILSKSSVQKIKNSGLNVKVGVEASYKGAFSAQASAKFGVDKQAAAMNAVQNENKEIKVNRTSWNNRSIGLISSVCFNIVADYLFIFKFIIQITIFGGYPPEGDPQSPESFGQW